MADEQSPPLHEEDFEGDTDYFQGGEDENSPQDPNLISSLQESLKSSQDNEASLWRELNKLRDMQMRERIVRDLDHYKDHPSRSYSRDRHHRNYGHSPKRHHRTRRSPSRPRHYRHRDRRSPSPYHRSRHYSERRRRSPSYRPRSRSPPPRRSRHRDRDHSRDSSSRRLRSPSSARSHRSSSSTSSLFEGFPPSECSTQGREIIHPSFEQRPSSSSSNVPSLLHSNNDITHEEPCFTDGNETYVVFNPNFHQHVDNNPSQIFWNQDKISVKWHGGKTKAFCQINEETSSQAPYGTSKTAAQILRDNLGLSPVTDSTGFKKQALSTHFDPASGLGLALSIAQTTEEFLVHHLIAGDRNKAMNSFKNVSFEAPTTTIFSSGWPKGNHHFKWANGTKLDLTKAALLLRIDTTDSTKKSIFTPLLDKELETRTNLVNQITGLRALELFSDKFNETDNKKSTVLAIAKTFIPVLKTLLVDWMEAKLKLRKAVLHNQDTEAVRILLRADMWSPSLFSDSSIEEIKNFKDSNLRRILNLNLDGSLSNPQFNKGRPQRHRPRSHSSLHYKNQHLHKNKKEDFKRPFPQQPFLPPGNGKNHSTNKSDPSQSTQQTPSHRGKSSQRGRLRGKNK